MKIQSLGYLDMWKTFRIDMQMKINIEDEITHENERSEKSDLKFVEFEKNSCGNSVQVWNTVKNEKFTTGSAYWGKLREKFKFQNLQEKPTEAFNQVFNSFLLQRFILTFTNLCTQLSNFFTHFNKPAFICSQIRIPLF